MACVDGPLFSGQASGPVGGIEYNKNRSGAFAKGNISPNDVRSPNGSQYRAQAQQFCAFQFANIDPNTLSLWEEFAEQNEWKNRFGQKMKLTAQQWYVRSCIPARLYFGISSVITPPTIGSHFKPNFEIEWTVNGIQLSFDINPTSSQCIVVWQHRNLLATQVRHNTLQRSHVIKYPQISPVLITGAITAFNDPPSFPFLINNTFTNVKVRTYTIFGLAMPELRFRVHTVN